MKKSILLIFYFFFPAMVTLYCCSVFSFSAGGNYYTGKNLDWPVGYGYIIINTRGSSNTALTFKDGTPFKWKSVYGSVTFNQFGKGMPLGGMNEKGLVVEELSYSPSSFPEEKGIPVVNELQWIQYQLDNFKSVEEVVLNISKIGIKKLLAGVHYFISDHEGNCAVVEFINNKVEIYSGKNLPVRALTNNRYKNSLKYLKLHSGFGASMVVRKESGSPERFVRASLHLKSMNRLKSEKPWKSAFRILDDLSQNDTQWSIVYDPVSLSVKIKTGRSGNIKYVKIKNLAFEGLKGTRFFDIDKEISGTLQNRDFTHLGINHNNKLVRKVIRELSDCGELGKADSEKYITIFCDHFLNLN